MADVLVKTAAQNHDGLRDVGGQRLLGGLRGFERLAVNRLDRGLALHHRHAARGPAEDEVGIEPLARHGVVAGAGRVIHREHDFR